MSDLNFERCIFTGSHGGRGGRPGSRFLTATESVANDHARFPVTPGSSGGGSAPGAGGGVILINAKNALIDGLISGICYSL